MRAYMCHCDKRPLLVPLISLALALARVMCHRSQTHSDVSAVRGTATPPPLHARLATSRAVHMFPPITIPCNYLMTCCVVPYVCRWFFFFVNTIALHGGGRIATAGAIVRLSIVLIACFQYANWFLFFSDNANEQKPDDAFREVIASCRSLSSYEPSNLKTALPQVIYAPVIHQTNPTNSICCSLCRHLPPSLRPPST